MASVARNAHIRGNERVKRLIAFAEEQAMEVTATLLFENDSDLALMRVIASRPVVLDADLDVLRQIESRMLARHGKLVRHRRLAARISRLVAA